MQGFADRLSADEIQALVGWLRTPAATPPRWGEAEMAASHRQFVPLAQLPDAPGHGADPAEWRSHWEGRDIQAQKRLTPLIEHIARRHQLEPALLHALITVESGYRADAASPKGAQGLMQLLKSDIQRRLPESSQIEGLTPELLTLNYLKLGHKVLPVRLSELVPLAPECVLADSVTITPAFDTPQG
jgi:hypothetical protein